KSPANSAEASLGRVNDRSPLRATPKVCTTHARTVERTTDASARRPNSIRASHEPSVREPTLRVHAAARPTALAPTRKPERRSGDHRQPTRIAGPEPPDGLRQSAQADQLSRRPVPRRWQELLKAPCSVTLPRRRLESTEWALHPPDAGSIY